MERMGIMFSVSRYQSLQLNISQIQNNDHAQQSLGGNNSRYNNDQRVDHHTKINILAWSELVLTLDVIDEK